MSEQNERWAYSTNKGVWGYGVYEAENIRFGCPSVGDAQTACRILNDLEAQLAAARADAGILYDLLDWLLSEMPACDKDEGRDYCVTHYTKHCAVEAKIAKARTALAIHVSLAGETTA